MAADGSAFLPLDPPYGMLEKPYLLNGDQPSSASNGGFYEADLDADALYRGCDLVVTYSYTAGTGGTLRSDNPFSLIREIALLAGSGDVVQRMSGFEAFLLAQIQRGAANPLIYDRVPATTTAVSSGKFVVPLDFIFQGAHPAHFGLIPARYLTGLKLRIDWAASLTDAIGYGMGGSPAITATAQIMKRLVMPQTDPAPQGYGSRVCAVAPFPVAATGTGMPMKFEAGVRYDGFLFLNRDTSNAATSDSAGVTGNVQILLDSGYLKYKASFAAMRQLLKSRFPVNYPGTTTAFDFTGILYADVSQRFSPDSDSLVTLAQCMDATTAREVRVEADVTVGTSTVVRVVPVRVRSVLQSAIQLGLPVG